MALSISLYQYRSVKHPERTGQKLPHPAPKSAAALRKKHKVNGETIIEIPNFPKLTNEDSHLAIMTNEENPRMIDKCSYLESMHSSGNKRNQGISLEKKSPDLVSSKQANWHSSKDTTGGTPGIKNTQE